VRALSPDPATWRDPWRGPNPPPLLGGQQTFDDYLARKPVARRRPRRQVFEPLPRWYGVPCGRCGEMQTLREDVYQPIQCFRCEELPVSDGEPWHAQRWAQLDPAPLQVLGAHVLRELQKNPCSFLAPGRRTGANRW